MERATSYSPSKSYTLPTLIHVEDWPGTDEYPAVSHWECRVCGEHIRPGTCADDTIQYIRGFGGGVIDVTCLNRPDPSWRFVDALGHEHCWYVE